MLMALITAGSWLSEFFAAFAEKFAERFSTNKDIGAEISEAIMQVQMYFNVGDYKLLITDAIIVTWVAVIAILIVVGVLTGKPSKDLKLTKGQALLVSLTELVITTAMSFGMNRKQAEEVAPMIMTFGLVITACNSGKEYRFCDRLRSCGYHLRNRHDLQVRRRKGLLDHAHDTYPDHDPFQALGLCS